MARSKQRQRPLLAGITIVLIIILLSKLWSFAIFSPPPLPVASQYFPRKIWQTWKVDALALEERESKLARTWTAKNPRHRHEILTDQTDLTYVESHFGPSGLNRLDIVHVFRELTARIVKADLLRYLVMYREGGVYADIDVEALRPIEKFIPQRYNERNIDMVIGVEVDQPEFRNHDILGLKCASFCQWTFMCKPGLPVMLHLVDDIVIWVQQMALRQNTSISNIQFTFDDIIAGSGPSAFTRAILAYMSSYAGHPVTWDTFHSLDESKLVGNILVLTVEAFAAAQGHSDSGNHEAKQALVKHHFHASKWPTAHPRFDHPMYGPVERCNWDPVCVKTWDADRSAFDALSTDEQQRQTALKQAKNAKDAEEANEANDAKH